MSYKPLDTSMERIKILTKLRLKEIIFPPDFEDDNNQNPIELIRYVYIFTFFKKYVVQLWIVIIALYLQRILNLRLREIRP